VSFFLVFLKFRAGKGICARYPLFHTHAAPVAVSFGVCISLKRDAHIVDFVGSLLTFRLCVCVSPLSLCLSVCVSLCLICVYERELGERMSLHTHTHKHVYGINDLPSCVCVCVCK